MTMRLTREVLHTLKHVLVAKGWECAGCRARHGHQQQCPYCVVPLTLDPEIDTRVHAVCIRQYRQSGQMPRAEWWTS